MEKPGIQECVTHLRKWSSLALVSLRLELEFKEGSDERVAGGQGWAIHGLKNSVEKLVIATIVFYRDSVNHCKM